MNPSDKPDYRLVYDGEGGLRMAPINTAAPDPDPHIAWTPDGEARLETHLDPPLPPPTGSRRRVAIAGVLLFCVVGLGVGLAQRLPRAPDLTHGPPPARGQVRIAAATPPPAAARPAPRLDVLSADIESKVHAAAPAVAPVAAPPPQPAGLASIAPPPARTEPVPRAEIASRPTPGRPDCGWARTPAETMVCNDPDLAADDRRLAGAYRGAARSGVDLYQLRAEQDDWLDLREDAARTSRQAVARLYEQRISELEAMADPQ